MKSKLHTKPDQVPGKANKLLVGDKVELKFSAVEWYVEHLIFLYRVGGTDTFNPESYDVVEGWLNAYRTRKPVVGIVTGFGGEADRNRRQKDVKVTLRFAMGARDSGYHAEYELKKVK